MGNMRTTVSLTILSLDTAVAPVLGNLDHRSTTWEHLESLYLGGFVAATKFQGTLAKHSRLRAGSNLHRNWLISIGHTLCALH